MAQPQPVGPFTSTTPGLSPDASSPTSILHGKHVTLRPLSPSDAPALYKTLCGPSDDTLWTYLPRGPFPNLESFTETLTTLYKEANTFLFVIILRPSKLQDQALETSEDEHVHGTPVGIISLLSIVPAHRRLEIGMITYARQLQRSTAATEAVFLLLRYAFEELGNERVEWKCDALNGPSRAAAGRLGWRAEGEFKKHMVVKGRRRDTAWFSIIDKEWTSGVKEALEQWLGDGNFDEAGRQKRRLEDIRQGILNSR